MLPPNDRVYKGHKDFGRSPKNLISARRQSKKWPIASMVQDVRREKRIRTRKNCSGSGKNWFDSLDPKSVDGFEELSSKFLEEFSQQKRYDKDPTEINGIKRKPNEGLQAFMDRFKE
ncbi:reverse transcriptase domain-containing protein [Tanacetum coccineum]